MFLLSVHFNLAITLTNVFSTSTSMATRTGFRNVLGDITKQQNIPQKVAVVETKVTTRQAAAKRPHPDAIVSAGQEGLAVERFFVSILFNSAPLNVFDQESTCWCGGYRREGLGEPAAVRGVHSGHVRLPQVGKK